MWFVLLLFQVATAFNVYQDLYAKPYWQVNTDGLITDAEAAPLADRADHITMAMHGDKYLCHLPSIQPTEPTNRTDIDLVQAKTKAQELLAPLKDQCLYYVAGYWMYQACYNGAVKQFHPDSHSKQPKPQPGTPVFTLGKKEKNSEVRNDGDVNYLKHTLGDGSYCDLTGKPRTVDIRYFCREGIDEDSIAWIREIKTCTYVMAINTPRLCSDVAFLPPQDEQVNEIECKRVVTPQVLEQEKEKSAVKIDYDNAVVKVADPELDTGTFLDTVLDEMYNLDAFVFEHREYPSDRDFSHQFKVEDGPVKWISVGIEDGSFYVTEDDDIDEL